MQNTYPKAVELRKKPVDDCVLVHDALHRKVHVLNLTAAAILDLCDGHHSAEQITASLAAATSMQPEAISGDVDAALKHFAELEILETNSVIQKAPLIE
jgi:hypothetical protein